mgnify:FL=1
MKKTKSFLALALCFCMILGLPALPNVFDGISLVTTAEAADEFTLDRVEVQDDETLLLYFSDPVGNTWTSDIQTWSSIRIVDENYKYVTASNGEVLQWAVTMDYPSGYPNNPMSATLTGATLGCDTISEILALVQPGADYAGYKVCMSLEEKGSGVTANNGFVESYFNENDSSIKLKGNNNFESYDSANVVIPGGEAYPSLVSVEKVAEDPYSLTLQFSEAVALGDLTNTFSSIRFVNNMEEQLLMWENNGTISTAEVGTPLQWSGDLKTYDGDATKLTFTLHEGHNLTIDEVLAKVGEDGAYRGLYAAFSFRDPTGTVSDMVCDAIKSTSGKAVLATVKDTWADYVYYSLAYTKPAGITLDSAIISGEKSVALQFSGPVANNGSGTYVAIRIVDNLTDQNLQWSGGAPAQWACSMDYPNGSDFSVMRATIADTAFGVDTISGIQTLVEEGGIFEGCAVTFCMEETIGTGGNGFMEGYWDLNLNGWSYDATNSFLRATRVVENQYDGIYVPLTKGFEIVEARIYNDTEVLVEFSENFNQTGKYYSAVRLLDADGNLVWINGTPQQWNVVFYDYYNGKTLRGQLFMQGGTVLQKYSDIVNYAATLDGVASIQFFIGDEHGGYIGWNALIDDFVTADGRKLQASFVGAQDGVYAPIKTVDGISVEAVEAIGETSYRVTFSEEVTNTLFSSSTGYCALRIVNSNQQLMWQNGDEITTDEAGTPLQWSGTMSPTTDASVWIFKTADYTLGTKNYSRISGLVADGGKYEDYELMFCIEEQNTGSNLPQYVDNFTSLDGERVLEATNLNSYGNGNYSAITRAFDNTGITLETVEAISPTQLVLTFSEDIKLVCNEEKNQPFMAFRFVDPATGIVVFDDAGTPLQWGGYYEFYHGQQNRLLWTMHGGNTYGISNITDILEGEGLEEFAEQYLFGFVIEEHPDPMTEGFEAGDGVVNNITGLDTGKSFYSNINNPGGGYDGYIAEEIVIRYDNTRVEMLRADVETDSSLVVTFSEPVTIKDAPFCAIRYVGDDGFLAWTGETNASTPLQWSGYFEYTEDPCKLRFVLHGGQAFGVENVQDIIEHKGELADYRQYKVMLAIEETGSVNVANGLVENVVDSDGNYLDATLPTRPGWFDGAYCNIYGKTNFKKVYIESATAVNDLEIVVKFSEPVVFTGNPWMSIRMIDASTGMLYWDGGEWEKGTPMQWGGSWQWNNAEHTEIRWTINSDNTYKVSNLTDLFNYAKDLEQLKDNEDLFYMFNIEELPEGGIFGQSGHIDNIRSAADDRSRLIATYASGYDGILYDIAVDYNAEDYLTYSATAINSRQILVQFNDVVEITGNPFMALRYVSGDNTLMWTDGKENYGCPLQFSGTWEWADDSHTAVIWTMNASNTYLANTITDVVTYKNGLEMFKGAAVKFCIEELSDENITVHGMDNLVHNITADGGTRHLYGEKMNGYDGSYKWISLDYDMSELAVVGVESSDDSTLLITFTEKPEFDENADMGIVYLDGGGGRIFDKRGRSLSYRGTWEYANEEGTQVKWTIDKDKDVSIKDFISFNGEFEEYFGADVKFYIKEVHDEDAAEMYDGLICNVTSKDGAVKLSATNIAEYDVLYMDINTTYEIVYPEIQAQTEEPAAEVITETVFKNDYIWIYIAVGAMVAMGIVLGVILGNKATKKKGSEGK